MKSIALFDDGSRASNYLKLHFQNKPGFSVTRVYSREELDQRMRKTPFDLVISPNGFHAAPSGRDGVRLCLFWSSQKSPKSRASSPDTLSFIFEIETPDTSLSFRSSEASPLAEQLDALTRLLLRIDKYHRTLSRFQADAEILQAIVENTGQGILYLLRNTIQWANPESLRILGRIGSEVTGRSFAMLFPDENHYRETLILISRNRASGGWGTARCSLSRKEGGYVDCTLRMRRLHPMNSQKGYLVVIEDDRDRRRLEAALNAYQEQVARNEVACLDLLQKMDQIIIRTDPEGTIGFWNSRAEEVTGFSPGAVIGKNLLAVTTDPSSRSAADMAVLLCDPGTVASAPMQVLELRGRDGRRIWTAWNTLVCRDHTGRTAGIVWIGQDISGIGDSHAPPGKRAGWKEQLLEGTGITEAVFDILFHTAIQLGRGGRESREVGTAFIIGDSGRVMALSRQCSINAFEGKEQRQRMIQDQATVENLKNLALLDGAFVIDASGYVHASSRHLLADAEGITLPQGFGTRHASAAAMTARTRSVGIVVSESGGTVTLLRNGGIVKQIEP